MALGLAVGLLWLDDYALLSLDDAWGGVVGAAFGVVFVTYQETKQVRNAGFLPPGVAVVPSREGNPLAQVVVSAVMGVGLSLILSGSVGWIFLAGLLTVSVGCGEWRRWSFRSVEHSTGMDLVRESGRHFERRYFLVGREAAT